MKGDSKHSRLKVVFLTDNTDSEEKKKPSVTGSKF